MTTQGLKEDTEKIIRYPALHAETSNISNNNSCSAPPLYEIHPSSETPLTTLLSSSSSKHLCQRKHDIPSNRISNILANEFNQERFSDVHIIVGSNGGSQPTAFFCHKVVLSQCQPLLDLMNSYSVDASSPPISTITLPSSTPLSVEIILRWLYTGNISLDVGDIKPVVEIAYLSTMWGLLEVRSFAEEVIECSLNSTNALLVLDSALGFSLHELVTKAIEYIKYDVQNSLSNPYFIEMSTESVQVILAEDQFAIDEVFLLEKAAAWTRHQAAQKKIAESEVFQEVIELIRFHRLSYDQVVKHVQPLPFIPSDFKVKMLCSFAASESTNPETGDSDNNSEKEDEGGLGLKNSGESIIKNNRPLSLSSSSGGIRKRVFTSRSGPVWISRRMRGVKRFWKVRSFKARQRVSAKNDPANLGIVSKLLKYLIGFISG
eukprot:TRINITY_DN2560_c0_g1_i3.p1 TRINITY_DN2560_c0_g1~~TRINITY_DN2560_c0_g1_i3.p1  ORF type:complete len:433 (-),score=62.28 TRINITY_DN2560_c0_g1_i3:195-1493(-)